MSLVFFGTPLFAVPSLDALVSSGEEVEAVVTQKDRRRDRGHALLPPPVKEAAVRLGIKVLQPSTMKDEAFLRELAAIGPEFIIVVAYGKILPRAVLDMPRRYAINLHASLLPRYRGASPVAWAIINGETETGVTTMVMSEGLDEGDILLQDRTSIDEDETAETLLRKLSGLGASLLVKTLRGLREGSLEPRPQMGEPSYAPPMRKEDGRVHWSKTAREIYNFVRGMHPWPGAYCHIGDERVKLLEVKPVEGAARPGEIRTAGDSLLVGTGDGLLSIARLQPEGRKAMTAGAYLRGRSIREGTLID